MNTTVSFKIAKLLKEKGYDELMKHNFNLNQIILLCENGEEALADNKQLFNEYFGIDE